MKYSYGGVEIKNICERLYLSPVGSLSFLADEPNPRYNYDFGLVWVKTSFPVELQSV